MKKICLQFCYDSEKKINELELILNNIGFSPNINKGEDNGSYANIIIETEDLKKTWIEIKSKLLRISKYSDSLIVVCEGSDSWNDYLLLYDPDKSQKCDIL